MIFSKSGVKHKFYFFGLLLLAVVLFFSSCEEEETVSRDYPRLREVQIVNVSDSGATFMAELYSLGNEAILDHGFVWGTDGALDAKYSDRILLGEIDEEGTFNALIRSSLKTGKVYFVKAFVRTDKRTVYSSERKFSSLGSLGATITGFTPITAGLRDTLLIRGRNFSWINNQNIVKVGPVTCYPFESTDSTIKIEVPPGIKEIKNFISVDVAGSVSYFTRDTFKLIPPSVTDYYPKTGYWGDTITLTGNYLNALGHLPTDFIKINNYICPRIYSSSGSKNILKIQIPDDLDEASGIFSLEIAGFPFSLPVPFELKEPYFTFAPTSGTWADRVILKGRFSIKPGSSIVYFDNNPAPVLSVTNSELQVSIPYALNSPECSVLLRTNPYEISSPVHFNLFPPEIRSFQPASGSTGSVITLHGKRFGNPARYITPEVYFRDQRAEVRSYNDSTILALVPNTEGGLVNIKVVVASMTAESSDLFSIGNPYITSVYPLTGTFNDEITVEGANFTSEGNATRVFFDGFESEIVSLSSGKVVVKVPASIDSIPHNIRIYAGGNNCTSDNMFTLLPPTVSSFTPANNTPGSDVIINGMNFNPVAGNNSVSWCGFQLVVKSSTANQLTATWPEILVRSEGPLRINVGGYTRASSQNIIFTNSKWRKIQSPLIWPISEFYGHWAGDHLYGKAINGYGYVVTLAHKVYRFNPAALEWTEISSENPAISFPHSSAEVIAGDSLYLISGYECYSRDIIRLYSPLSNTWRLIPEGPYNQMGVGFYLNGKIYFGLDNYSWSGIFYQSDIQDNYKWTRIGDFPEQVPSRFSTYFTSGNRGYVLFARGALWEFNPGTLGWTRKNNFPGEPRDESFTFELNGRKYIGGGQNGYQVFDDIWEYDADSDNWNFYTKMPFKRFGSVAFTINGKLYIGYGFNYDNGLNTLMDFYEYDPEYPVF